MPQKQELVHAGSGPALARSNPATSRGTCQGNQVKDQRRVEPSVSPSPATRWVGPGSEPTGEGVHPSLASHPDRPPLGAPRAKRHNIALSVLGALSGAIVSRQPHPDQRQRPLSPVRPFQRLMCQIPQENRANGSRPLLCGRQGKARQGKVPHRAHREAKPQRKCSALRAKRHSSVSVALCGFHFLGALGEEPCLVLLRLAARTAVARPFA